MPIRILHFSDFHLDGRYIKEAKTSLHYMIDSIQKEHIQPDLILFTGDMLNRGGSSFAGDIRAGFEEFKANVMDVMCAKLGLDLSRFIIVPGNHDVDRDADDPMLESGLEEQTGSEESVSNFILTNTRVANYTQRIQAYKDFEKSIYEPLLSNDYLYSRFASAFRLQINGHTVGIYGLNTAWRCGEDDVNKIVLGLPQITQNTPFLEQCEVRIAMSHHRYDYLKHFELEPIRTSLSENCIMYFSGHAHKNHVEYTCLERGGAFFDVNTAGSLVANEFVSEECHRNAFQIVTYYPEEKRILASVYRQQGGAYFELDKNFGDRDKQGICERSTLSHAEIIALARRQAPQKQEMEESAFYRSIFPLQRIQDYPIGKDRFKEEFIPTDTINKLMEQLTGPEKRIRFMALSGMGKTRIVLEAFKDKPDVYYSPISRKCEDGILKLITEKRDGVIIIDNCPIQQMYEIQRVLSSTDNHFKLITIHNELSVEEKNVESGVLLELKKEDSSEIIDKILKDDPLTSVNPDFATKIKDLSGDIPYMAILMLQAYTKNHNLRIESREEVLRALLNSSTLSDDQRKVLSSVALFEPLGKDDSVKDEYDYVTHNYNVHHIAQKQDVVDLLYRDTLREYEKRQLVEHDGMCIRVRPLLLAEWLSEEWLQQHGEDFAGIIKQIQSLDANLSSRLLARINRRFEGLRQSPYAKELVENLNIPQSGVFSDERLAFSNAGSQLFLSMGQVSPAAVAQNMYALLQKKSISWLKNEMDYRVRRNWVWALTNIVADADAFPYAARAILLLAIAESEHYANNATGQFKQLFHIMLSGTMAPYEPRVELLEEMYEQGVDRHLIMDAIRNAYTIQGVHLDMNDGARDEEGNLREYHPKTYGHIHRYWMSCKDLLEKIANEDEAYRKEIREWLPKCLRDMCEQKSWVVYEKILESFYREGEDWMEMYKGVTHYLEYGLIASDLRAKLKEWQQKLEPKDFCNRLNQIQIDAFTDRKRSFEERWNYEAELMRPMVKEFIDKELYEDGYTLRAIIRDEAYHNHHFAQELVKELEKDDYTFEAVAHYMIDAIKKEPKEFESIFVGMFVSYIQDVNRLNRFREALFDKRYYRMTSSIDGTADDEKHSRLALVLDAYDEGKYDAYCVDNYLRRVRYHELGNVLEIFHILRNHPSEELNSLAYRFISYSAIYTTTEDIQKSGKLKELEEVLLSYPYKEQANQWAHEYVRKMEDILTDFNDPDFAFAVHRKAVETLSPEYISNNPFEQLYFTLLPKYQDAILRDLLEVLADEKNLYFGLSMTNHLGSGFNTGKGPLFQCDVEPLKEACRKYPKRMPRIMANMCPIYEWEGDKKVSLSKFFLWLCDEFGDDVDVLHAFSANLNTFSWSGFGGMADHYSAEIPYIEPLLNHPKRTVREWAKAEIKSIQRDVERETNNDNYERMTRG